MKKVTIKAPESESEIEKLNKIYRLIGDVVSKHDNILKKKEKLDELFLHDAILLRDRLVEYCEKLLLSAAAELRVKAEEVLWRKCFYNVIKQIRKAGKIVDSNLLNAYWLHLKSACGFYLQLLMRLQYDFNLTFPSDLSPVLIPKSLQRCNNGNENIQVADLQIWAINLSHKCLIYLGDLARYESDCFDIGQKVVAQRYYYQALTLNPHNGIGYNQLGSLASHSNLNLNAAYYYFRSMLCRLPFEGSATNLVKLLEANITNFQRYNGTPQIQSLQKNKVKKLIIDFLMLIYCLHTNKSNVQGREVRQICECVLSNLNECLAIRCQLFQISGKSDSGRDAEVNSVVEMAETQNLGQFEGVLKQAGSDLLEGDVILRMLLILISAIHLNIQQKGSEFGAGIAVGLSIFSHILNCTNISLSQLTNSLPKKNDKDRLENKEITPDSKPSQLKRNNTQKQKLSMLRRGRGDSEGSEESNGSSPISNHSSQESLRSEDELNVDKLSSTSNQSVNRWSSSSSQSDNLDDVEDQSKISPSKKDASVDALDEAIDNLSLILPKDIQIDQNISKASPVEESCISHDFKNSLPVDWSKYENFTKEISVPPGFESSMEVNDVAELSTKLANFDIDTDTDTQFTDAEIDSNYRVRLCVDGTLSVDLLPSILIFSHWLIANPDVITNCAKVSSNIWMQLLKLLNFFPTEKKLLNTPEMVELESRLNGETLESSLLIFRLPEEIHLNYFPPIPNLPPIPDNIINSSYKIIHLNIRQEAVLRMWRLCKFGLKVCEMNSVGLHFNVNTHQFNYSKPITNQPPISSLNVLQITPNNKKRQSAPGNTPNSIPIVKDTIGAISSSSNNNNLTSESLSKNISTKTTKGRLINSNLGLNTDTRTTSQLFVQQFYSNINRLKNDGISDEVGEKNSGKRYSHSGDFRHDDYKDALMIEDCNSTLPSDIGNQDDLMDYYVITHENDLSRRTSIPRIDGTTFHDNSHDDDLILDRNISNESDAFSDFKSDADEHIHNIAFPESDYAADNDSLMIHGNMEYSSHHVDDASSSLLVENALTDPATSKSENDVREAAMRSMAKLRLQNDVSRLEGKATILSKGVFVGSFRPIIAIIDADIIPNQLNKLLFLADKHRFTLVLPNAVVVELDFLKKEHAYARDIIRILEKQFQRGHKWLQAQKKGETTNCFESNNQITDKHFQRLIELANCSQFFFNQQNQSTNKMMPSNQQKKISQELTVSSNQNDLLKDPHDKQTLTITEPTHDVMVEKNDFVFLLLSEASQLKLNELAPLKSQTFQILTVNKFIDKFKL